MLRPPAVVLALALVSSCGSAGPPALLVLTLDTTRADRLGCYGRERADTAHLDSIAARGVRFERAYTPVPITLPAHAALFTGTGPRTNGVRDNGQFQVDERLTTLAELLRARGYRNGAVVGAYPLFAEFGLAQGFDYYDDDLLERGGPEGAPQERRGDLVVASAAAWLGTLPRGEPFFLWAHFFDPHWPYEPPAPFGARHADDAYQGEIAFVDDCVGKLLAAAQERADGELLVLAVADHGEALGEHDEATHAFLIHDATVRVPLLLAGPGVPAARVVREPVATLDVLPTLCELLDVAAPFEAEGASLVPLWLGQPDPPRTQYVESYFLSFHHGWSPLEGLVERRFKYIEASGTPRERDELYDLELDPHELDNVAAREPERLAAMRAALCALRRATPASPYRASHTLDGADLESLAQLGYAGYAPSGEASAELAAIHPRDRILAATGFTMAKGLIQRGDLAQAWALILELEQADPDGVGAVFLRALYYTRVGRSDPAALDLALVEYRRALALASERTPIWRNLAEAHRLRGDLLESLVCLRTAARLGPGLPVVQREYADRLLEARRQATLLEARGRRAEALALLEHLLLEDPDSVELAARAAALRGDG